LPPPTALRPAAEGEIDVAAGLADGGHPIAGIDHVVAAIGEVLEAACSVVRICIAA
jgi:hypothetical protein